MPMRDPTTRATEQVDNASLTDTGRERYEQLLGLRQPAPCRVLLD
ncbi:MAG: hypothetical protein ACRDSM_17585 [Pseudonocardiaceae bacterium]